MQRRAFLAHVHVFSTFRTTVWKFHDFSITQILREINVGDARNAKSAISIHSEALNLDFYKFLHFLKTEIYQIDKIQSPKMVTTAVLDIEALQNWFHVKSE